MKVIPFLSQIKIVTCSILCLPNTVILGIKGFLSSPCYTKYLNILNISGVGPKFSQDKKILLIIFLFCCLPNSFKFELQNPMVGPSVEECVDGISF